MSKKPIIVFEGIEGTGKSHHIKKVANYLTRKKIKFIQIYIDNFVRIFSYNYEAIYKRC